MGEFLLTVVAMIKGAAEIGTLTDSLFAMYKRELS